MTDCEIAWAAGLFEGEGCITICKRECRPTARINMTDEDVIRRFHAIVGIGKVYGPYQSAGNRKPYWTWYARQADAFVVIEMLADWLSHRRLERTEEVRYLWKHGKRQPGQSGWSRQRRAAAARAEAA